MSFYKRIFFMVLYWISFLSIRSNKVWVFGSYGVFNDNSKYLYLDSIYDKNIRKIWISKNNEEDYILENRDFYSEIYSHKPGVVVRNLNDFLFALKDIKLGNDVREKERMELRKLLSLDLVGSESRLYSKIIEKLGM